MKQSLRAKLDSQAKRLEELNRLLSAEDVTRDLAEFKRLSREHAELTHLAEIYGRYRQAERDAAAARDMAADPSMKGFADEETKSAQAVMDRLAGHRSPSFSGALNLVTRTVGVDVPHASCSARAL